MVRPSLLEIGYELMRILTVFLATIFMTTAATAQTAPSSRDIAAFDPLHMAAHLNDADEVRRLIAAGSDPNIRDRRGRTPAHVAAFASADDALTALAEGGADMNALEHRAYDIVTIAAVADDPELMSLAIALGNDPGLTTSPYDGTALIAAAHLGHDEVVRRLIGAGAPLDHINNLGWTALIEAVILGDGGPRHQRVVQALIDAGADPNIPDRNGRTPLQQAELEGYTAIADIIRATN
jgi:ankyrin repeat protein